MKKKIGLIIKIGFILLLLVWIVFVFMDNKRARNATKPLICLSEKTENWSNGIYYECTSFGYKYYELQKQNNTKDYGFMMIFSKNPLREKYGETNEQ